MRRLLVMVIIITSGCGSSREAAELYQSGMKEFSARRLGEAEKYFLLAVEKDSSLLNASLMLCKVYYYNGNYRSAIQYSDMILDSDPDHAAAMYWKARSLIMSIPENTGEAASLLVRSLEIDGHNIQARLLLGMIYEKDSRYADALYQYMAVIDEEEGIIAAHGNLALLYRRMGLEQRSGRELAAARKIAELSGKGEERIKYISDEIGGYR